MTRERYFSNAYDIRNSRGDLISTISERALDRTSTSLVLHGRGFSPYGLARNENIVHKLENFSNTTPPKNPIDGQLWWKRAEEAPPIPWPQIDSFTQQDTAEWTQQSSSNFRFSNDGTFAYRGSYDTVPGNFGIIVGSVYSTAYVVTDSLTPTNILTTSITANDIAFSGDGTKLFIARHTGGLVEERTNIGTPFQPALGDVDTVAYTYTSTNLTSIIQSINFSADGTVMYLTGRNATFGCVQATLSTPWDMSTAGAESTIDFTDMGANASYGLRIAPDGLKFYVCDLATAYEYNCTVAWDITGSAVYQGRTLTIGAEVPGNIFGFDVSPDGTTLVAGGAWGNTAANNDTNRFTSAGAAAISNVVGELYGFDTAIGSPSWRTVVPPSSGIGFSVTPGDGFDQTTGGLPTGSPLSVTIDLSAGRGISLGSNAVGVQASQITHDNLIGFVANEHLDHAAIVLTGGAGIVGGSPGFPITSSVSLNIGAGRGITVNTNDVAINNATVMRTTGNQNVSGIKTFTQEIFGDIGSVSASVPSFAFSNDSSTGWYRSGTNQVSFTTGAVQRFRIESGGVLRAIPSNYEALVIDDNDIPNKKYVDGAVSGGSNPTAETHVGYKSISGLTPNAKYLVNVYGRIFTAGTGYWVAEGIKLRRGTTTVGGGTLVASTPSQGMNWPDGSTPTSATFIVDMDSDTDLNSTTDTQVGTGPFEGPGAAGVSGGTTWMHAIRISDPPPLGSPLPYSGAPELDDVAGNTNPPAFVIWPSGFNAVASIWFGGTGAWPYTYNPIVVSHAGGSTAAFVSYSQIGNDWFPGAGTPGDFELRANTISLTGAGITASGTTGTWLDLSSNRNFWLSKSGASPGSAFWVLEFEIRQKTNPFNTTGVVTYTLHAESII